MLFAFWARCGSRYKLNKPRKPYYNYGKKINPLSILLILIGIVLVIACTPPWVWCFLLGLGFICIGIFIFNKQK
jgi:hypothetical protein